MLSLCCSRHGDIARSAYDTWCRLLESRSAHIFPERRCTVVMACKPLSEPIFRFVWKIFIRAFEQSVPFIRRADPRCASCVTPHTFTLSLSLSLRAEMQNVLYACALTLWAYSLPFCQWSRILPHCTTPNWNRNPKASLSRDHRGTFYQRTVATRLM